MRTQPDLMTPIFRLRDEDFTLNEGDKIRGVVNGIGSLCFSDRVHSLVDKGMKSTVVVKLLGRKVSVNALQNRLYAVWKPNGKFLIMDLDNDYFQIRFSIREDYTRVLAEGPWIVFGHNLTVQPWTSSFTTSDPFPTNVVTWIRIPGIPGSFYWKPLLEAIGEMVGKVIKIDDNTTKATRGRFVRMAVVVDLKRPLVSKIMLEGVVKFVEYEALPLICFECSCYGHLQMACPALTRESEKGDNVTLAEKEKQAQSTVAPIQEEKAFGAWMVVVRRGRKGGTSRRDQGENQGGIASNSRFNMLGNMERDIETNKEDFLEGNGNLNGPNNSGENLGEQKGKGGSYQTAGPETNVEAQVFQHGRAGQLNGGQTGPGKKGKARRRRNSKRDQANQQVQGSPSQAQGNKGIQVDKGKGP